jgi:hypothetical protein
MSINRLLLMGGAHFVLMYILMYAMVNTFSHVFPNLNQVYMAGIMTAPMLIMETILMSRCMKISGRSALLWESALLCWLCFSSL